jgi:hypothetical protein
MVKMLDHRVKAIPRNKTGSGINLAGHKGAGILSSLFGFGGGIKLAGGGIKLAGGKKKKTRK